MSELDAQIVGAFGEPCSSSESVVDSLFRDSVCRKEVLYFLLSVSHNSTARFLWKKTVVGRSCGGFESIFLMSCVAYSLGCMSLGY